MGFPLCSEPPTGRRVGSLFELLTRDYLENAFRLIQDLRPGKWVFSVLGDGTVFDLYEHWTDFTQILALRPNLRATLEDYFALPDIVMGLSPVPDPLINQGDDILQGNIANLTPLRASNNPRLILHASISCKWTLRSDRGQNARTEALNLIRNRKGHLPHVMAVTAEPLPTRIASLALGTGDLDCVYHFALPELKEAISDIKNEDQMDMLNMLIEGRRLRDISDLPFDLAI
jgi:hypothetical protein